MLGYNRGLKMKMRGEQCHDEFHWNIVDALQMLKAGYCRIPDLTLP